MALAPYKDMAMNAFIDWARLLVSDLPPALENVIRRIWRLRPSAVRSRIKKRGRRKVGAYMKEHYRPIVRRGPFSGLKLCDKRSDDRFAMTLLGTYELEIHPWIDLAIRKGYSKIINVGCGEGYYTVGFANEIPEATVLAFDINPEARDCCRKIAILNNVSDRVTISGSCNAKEFRNAIEAHSLCFLDCEGCEYSLLNLEVTPLLAQCDIIVEVHAVSNKATKRRLISRFSESHYCTYVPVMSRYCLNLPELAGFSKRMRRAALFEERAVCKGWMMMQAREA